MRHLKTPFPPFTSDIRGKPDLPGAFYASSFFETEVPYERLFFSQRERE